jgi:hypothetical protein
MDLEMLANPKARAETAFRINVLTTSSSRRYVPDEATSDTQGVMGERFDLLAKAIVMECLN